MKVSPGNWLHKQDQTDGNINERVNLKGGNVPSVLILGKELQGTSDYQKKEN